MACNIERFVMTDKQVNNWCKLGCSIDCYNFLLKKYPLKEEHKQLDLFSEFTKREQKKYCNAI